MTILTFTPVSDAVAKRYPKSSVMSTVADFDGIGEPNPAFQDGALHLESIAGVTPAIADRYSRPFETLLAQEAGFSSINGCPKDAAFSYAVAAMPILNLERIAGASPEIAGRYPARPGYPFN